MPYANREQQLEYMRSYMKRKRMVVRIARLKQRKLDLLQRHEEEPLLRAMMERSEIGSWCDEEIARLEGLLKNGQNSQKIGVTP